jgi:bacteriocin biosynthesis cyclodehydratase domain-containing protein
VNTLQSPNALPALPYVKPWLRSATEAEKLVFHYADEAVVLEGPAVADVLAGLVPLLDGTRSVDEIVAASQPAREATIRAALALLARNELLTSGPPLDDASGDRAQLVTFFAATAPSDRTLAGDAARLSALAVAAYGSGTVLDELERLMLGSGVARFARRDWPAAGEILAADADVIIVAPSPGELPQLASFNTKALEGRVPWLLVLPHDGHFAAVGPYFVPFETCCYACYTMRRAANVGYGDEYALLQTAPAPYPVPAAVGAIVAGYAALLILRQMLRDDVLLPGRFLAVRLEGEPQVETHTVYRVPRCPACSGARRDSGPAPWHEAA